MLTTVAQVDLTIPWWAYTKLVNEVGDIEAFENPDQIHTCEGHFAELTYYEVKYANTVAEEWLKQHDVPFDKRFSQGDDFAPGMYWFRVHSDGRKETREVSMDARPSMVSHFHRIDRVRNADHYVPGDDLNSLRRFERAMREWWEDHKPLEPAIVECKSTRTFLNWTVKGDSDAVRQG